MKHLVIQKKANWQNCCLGQFHHWKIEVSQTFLFFLEENLRKRDNLLLQKIKPLFKAGKAIFI